MKKKPTIPIPKDSKKKEVEKEPIPKSIYQKSDGIFIMVNGKPNSKMNSITGFNNLRLALC